MSKITNDFKAEFDVFQKNFEDSKKKEGCP